MKKLIAVCMAAVLAAPLFAQEEPVPESGPAHAPRIVCDQPTFEFGERDNSETVEHTFVIKNEGDLSLEISNIRAACGCTVANITSKLIAPGETADLTARLSLRGRSGRQRKSITVTSNDPVTPHLTLFLDGTAMIGIEAVPPRLFYGQITPAAVVEQCVEVRGGSVPFKIIAVESDSPKIATRMEVLEDGRKYRVCAATVPPLDQGQLRSTVTVRTDSEKIPVVNIPVAASVIGGIAVAPREISIPSSGDQPVTRFVVLRPSTAEEFQVKEVVVPDPSIEVAVVPMPTGFRIQLSNIRPGAEWADKKIVIHTTSEEMASIDIPFRVNP